jgi:hypothetical protein
MRLWTVLIGLVLGLLAGGCASDDRQWMKVGEKYTAAEFRRDYTECSRRGRLDEACLRSRGWVDVKPGKAEERTERDPLRQQRGTGLPVGQPY